MKDPKGKTTSFTYDGRTLLTKVTDAKQGVTSYLFREEAKQTLFTTLLTS
ncbi:MAG TPA: RHS repeat protein [Bacillales bacterium]|nr:RHS repeat protein [Bacillales bacterium]